MSLGNIRLDTSIPNSITDDDERATVKKVTHIHLEHNDMQRNENKIMTDYSDVIQLFSCMLF